MEAKQGTAFLGGQKVSTQGISSTGLVLASYPGATVTVFNFGTVTPSTIFSDNLGTPLSNPFTSSLVTGDFIFYAANGHYTIQLSGAGMPTTETITDVLLNDPTSSVTVTASAFISSSATPATSGVLRMASADTGPAWKSNLGGSDLAFTKNASDVVLLNTALTISGAFSTSSNPIAGSTISGTTGTFSGAITGASYSGGAIAGTTGTFSGAVLSATAISGTTGTFSGAITGAGYSGGPISGTTGTFSGAITGTGYTGGAISGTTGTFSSDVSVGGILTVTGTANLNGNVAVAGTTTLANATLGAASTLTVANIKQIANTGFVIADANGVAHVFLSATAPYTNLFLAGNGSGSVFIGIAGKTSVADTTGIITMSGSSSGTTTLQPSAVASGALTLPAETGTLAVKPTLTLKKGSGGGTYSSASTSYVQVDSTNLLFTVTIPNGWKLLINACFRFGTSTAVVAASVALADGGTVIVETNANQPAAGNANPGSLAWIITGDGASHTIDLRFKTGNALDSVIIGNSSATDLPTITFLLTPSN